MRRIRGLLIFWMVLLHSYALAQIRSQVKVFNDTFLSSSFEASNQNQNQFLGMKLKNYESDEGAFQIDAEGAFAFGTPLLSYIKVDEIYFETQTGQNQKLFLGRHKVNWSDLDTRWNFGVWQPIFKVNALDPSSEGLTGLFWENQNSWSELTFFASPVYLPNQGPNFDINEKGQFVKGNPWFNRPPDTIKIMKEVSQVEYTFDKPSESSVVLQSSYGARARLQNQDYGAQAQLSYAYLPMNNLALAYDGTLDISRDVGAVVIQPNVYTHAVLGTDASWANKWSKLGVSSVWDRPQKIPDIDSHWTYPVMDSAQLLSAFLDFDFRYIQFSIERLSVFGGDIHEVGALASTDRPSITSRYSFTEANRISMKNIFLIRKNRRLSSLISYTQSDRNKFQLVRWKGQLYLSSMWSVFSDLQLIQAGQLTAQNQNDIAQFANNDRLSFGVNYVF